ncbi:MAG: hypothetical protein HYY60_01265 [Parcubacteria group bacterium]|nr:hypothetical protein [Parcubacteria group bacterium]
MSFFGSLQKTSHKTPVLIFDIGGTSVGAALVLLAAGEKPYIVHTAREWLRPMEEVSLSRLVGLLEAGIDSVSKDVLALGARRLAAIGYGGALPRTVHCFITAPWYVPHMGTVRIAGENTFKVTQEMFARAIDEEKKSIEKKFGVAKNESAFAEAKAGEGGSTVSVMENQILSCAVNGYATESPYGQHANNVEFLLYTALADHAPLASFTARIGRTFHVAAAEPHSFLLAFFSAIRDSHEAEDDFLLCDMSGEVTEVSVARGGVLKASVSFPLGRNFLARALSTECKLSFEEALSLLAVHASSHGNEAFTARFCGALDAVERKWMRAFEESVAHIAEESFLPHSIFVAADKKIAPWVTAAVRNEALYQYTLTAKPFVTNLADEKTFGAHVAFGPGVAKDAFLMIDAMFLNKIKS